MIKGKMMLTSLLVILLPWRQALAQICVSVSAKTDVKLYSHVIKTSSMHTGNECVDQCRVHENCSSINFDPGNELCELNNGNHVSSPEYLLPAQGFLHLIYPRHSPARCSDTFCNKPFVCEVERNQGHNYKHKCVACHVGKHAFLLFPRTSILDKVVLENAFDTLTAFTLSLWIQTDPSSPVHVPFTYATAAGSLKQFGFFLDSYFWIALAGYWIKITGIVQLNDGKWHHLCQTWENTGGAYKVYVDGQLKGEGVKSIGHVITKGAIVLGLDQDSYLGKFDSSQTFQGNMTSVNIWDKVFTTQEISDLAKSFVSEEGNIVKWSDLNEKAEGEVKKYYIKCKDLGIDLLQ